MLNPHFARATFIAMDFLGIASLFVGFFAAALTPHLALGIAVAVSSVSWFAFAHIGRAVVQTAETNLELLKYFKDGAD